jgi:hypothetical protein
LEVVAWPPPQEVSAIPKGIAANAKRTVERKSKAGILPQASRDAGQLSTQGRGARAGWWVIVSGRVVSYARNANEAAPPFFAALLLGAAIGCASNQGDLTHFDGGAPTNAGSSSSSGSSSGASGASSSGSSSGALGASSSGSSSDASSSGSSSAASTTDATVDGGTVARSDAGGLFADCSLDGGCLADCAPPANDPIATGNANYDLYDGCILAGMQVAGMTEAWQGQLLKAQAMNESGITPSITTDDSTCGGQNCGIWAISAGSVSGDSPPGPCGSAAVDPFTGTVDYSHSYGLFQDTPACEGTFLRPSLPAGYTCTGTTEANNIPFGTNVTFYCESATSLGVSTPTGVVKGYINAVQDTSDTLYATSIFNPAYQLYVYLDSSWEINFAQANAKATGCTLVQEWYLSLAYWLTGNATSSCALTGAGQQYVQSAISNYEMMYGKTWPYPGP